MCSRATSISGCSESAAPSGLSANDESPWGRDRLLEFSPATLGQEHPAKPATVQGVVRSPTGLIWTNFSSSMRRLPAKRRSAGLQSPGAAQGCTLQQPASAAVRGCPERGTGSGAAACVQHGGTAAWRHSRQQEGVPRGLGSPSAILPNL